MSMVYPWASPQVVSAMTLPQLWIYLSKHDGSAVPSNAFGSTAERQAYADAVRARKGLD